MSRLLEPGVVEGQTLTKSETIDADVCIVGSGAGGAVAAANLQAAGLKVVVLEEGGYFTQTRFRMLEREAFQNLYQEGGARTTRDASLVILQGKAVGGTTVVNWTTSFRTPGRVLSRWHDVHGVKGFGEADLAPHWDRVERRLNIAQVPLEATNPNNRLLYDGCEKLGIQVETTHRNTRNCIHSGYCGMGCPVDAKQSMLVSYLPDAVSAGATVISRCRVDRLRFHAGKAEAAECTLLDASGREPTGAGLTVRAKRFILAAGAIGTPAILLRSGAPDPNRRLGMRTFLHPVVTSMAEFPDAVNGWYGAPQSVASHHYYDRGGEVGYLLEAAPVHPGLAASALPGYGEQHRILMERLSHMAFHLALTGDGLHDDVPGGTVSLRDDGTPVVDYPVAERTWAALRHAQKVMARVQFAAGAKAVWTFHDPALRMTSEKDIDAIDALPFAAGKVAVFSAHVMGGAGMSDDPKLGVVRSEDLRHHEIENLHVLDGSVFPTGLGVNPQLSIYGLADLMSTRLASRWT